jgi:hypothetical protein
MFRYSTIAAALILVGSVAAASAAPSHVLSAPAVTQIDQNGDYVISRTPGAIPAEPGAPNVRR